MIILDIDMPKNCDNCDLCTHCGIGMGRTYYCKVLLREVNTSADSRPSECPIVGEIPKTNQVMLGLTTPEEFVRKIDWLYHEYGKQFNNSEPAIIEWLKQKEMKDADSN